MTKLHPAARWVLKAKLSDAKKGVLKVRGEAWVLVVKVRLSSDVILDRLKTSSYV